MAELTAVKNALKIEHCRLKTDSATVYYQVAGAGHPVVLLHGLSGSGRWWAKNILPLANRFRVYVVDLLGFGGSRGQRFMLREASRVIEAWLDALGVDRFSIVGHSMGGFVAADLAAHIPERVDNLVLVDAAAVPIRRSLIRNAIALVEAVPYMPIDFLPVLAWDALRAGPRTLIRAIYDLLRGNLTVDLTKIQADTLIVWGEHDTLLTQELGEQLRSAMPGAEYVLIEGAGHNPMWDRPQVFNDVLIPFLEGRREVMGGKSSES